MRDAAPGSLNMWRRIVVALIIDLLASCGAGAQSTDQLQQIGQQAAAQYGVPWPIFDQLIQGESSWNPNIGCNAYGACGLAQFIPSTAATYGVDVNDPTSSLNGAAQYFSTLYGQSGSWTQALTRYSGGCNPARPCNPAYSQAFQDAAAVDNGGTVAEANPTTATGSSSPAIPTGGSIIFRPFQWTWDHVMIPAQTNTSGTISQVQNIAWIPAAAIITIAGGVWGVLMWAGRMSFGDAMLALITMGIVISLVTPGSAFYDQWVQFAEALPGYFASQLGGMNNAGPAGVFDGVWQAFLIKIMAVWHASPFTKIILTALLLFFVVADLAIMLGSMFFTFLVANFILYILLAVGAVFILGLLFPGTRGFFRFWLDLVVAVLIYILILDVMLGFFVTVLNQLIDAVGSATTPWSDMLPNLLGATIVFNVLAGVNAFLAFQIGRIHGAGSAAMTTGWAYAGSAARMIGKTS